MIYQQLEPICQPINCTFYMELYYNIPLPSLLYLLIYYNRDSQTTRERVILCELNGTSNNIKYTRVKTLFSTHYQNQCNSYGHSGGRLFNVRFPATRDRYPGFATGFRYFMTWRFEREVAFSIHLDMRVSFSL